VGVRLKQLPTLVRENLAKKGGLKKNYGTFSLKKTRSTIKPRDEEPSPDAPYEGGSHQPPTACVHASPLCSPERSS
jgi:hypothetical protein